MFLLTVSKEIIKSMSSNEINISINGKSFSVIEDQLLIEALKNAEDCPPALCYHPGLGGQDVCRSCLIEIEGESELVLSCKKKVEEGQQVLTNSEKVLKAQSVSVNSHLFNHPLDCPMCEKSGDCQLQEYSQKIDLSGKNISNNFTMNEITELDGISLLPSRCIKCNLCVEFESQITKTNTLQILGEGIKRTLTTVAPITHNFKENLVDLCPVGALRMPNKIPNKSSWNLKQHKTICLGCEKACGITLLHNNLKVLQLKSSIDEEVNEHWICDESRDFPRFLSGSTRVSSTLKRQDSYFIPCDESEILELTKDKTFQFVINYELTNEEIVSLLPLLEKAKAWSIFEWDKVESGEFFIRENRNANKIGVDETLLEAFPSSQKSEKDENADVLIFICPEINWDNQQLKTFISSFKNETKIGLISHESEDFTKSFDYLSPIPSFTEKQGTIVNYENKKRFLKGGLKLGTFQNNYLNWF